MIYSFHHFYYWMKGGVESGMAYRAKLFRELGLDARFVFATTFPNANIQHETEFLGFQDDEVIWLYGFFTDCKISPVTYTLEQFEKCFISGDYTLSRDKDKIVYSFPDGSYYQVYLAEGKKDCVHRVEMVSRGCLIRKDYYTYCRIYSEYYTTVNGQENLYLRRFFNEDGSVAYEEVMSNEAQVDDVVLYKFPDRLLYSREELVEYMMSCLHLTKDDVILIDAEPGKIDRAAFIQNAAPARVGMILHADHYLNSDADYIQWYWIYEYAFAHTEKIDFFITSTQAQSKLLQEQLKKYKGVDVRVETIPVMGLEELKKPKKARRKHSLISVGRLAPEKRMNWVIEAVVQARKCVPDLSLDIYGEGSEKGQLQRQIKEMGCEDYVQLCGFRKLDDVYQSYDAYISASWVETLGVTYLEAVGSGLPIIGFDVPYGTQVFIDEGENGYKLPWGDIQGLADAVVRLFMEADIEAFRQHSYQKASFYLTEEIKKQWKSTLIQTE